MKNTLSVAACGSSQFGQSTQTSDISVPYEFVVPSIDSIQAGGWHSAILCANQHVAFWGSNIDQQIPNVQSSLLRSPTNYQIPLVYSQIGLGSKHTLVLSNTGNLQCFGSNAQNQFPPTSFTKIKKIFAKFEYSGIITENNTIFVWGGSQKSIKIQLSDANEVPKLLELTPYGIYILCESLKLYFYIRDQEIYSYDNIVSVASSRTKAIVLKTDGRLYNDIKGKLIQITGINDLPIKVFAGGAHYGCVTLNGDCYTWGCGTRGQLGNGLFSNHAKPVKVLFDEKKCVIDAAAGEEHTIFLICKDDVFTPIVDKAMKVQPLTASLSASMIRDCSYIPPDYDIKF